MGDFFKDMIQLETNSICIYRVQIILIDGPDQSSIFKYASMYGTHLFSKQESLGKYSFPSVYFDIIYGKSFVKTDEKKLCVRQFSLFTLRYTALVRILRQEIFNFAHQRFD